MWRRFGRGSFRAGIRRGFGRLGYRGGDGRELSTLGETWSFIGLLDLILGAGSR